MFRNPDLARTYRAIASGGRDAFYEGDIAQTIERYFKRIGGWLSAADLAAHHSEWIAPSTTDYRGTTVHALGANTQGLADAPDAQHSRAVRPEGRRLPVRAVDSPAGRSQAARL
ncbi:gamma-glutamyltransferase [Sphingomonas aerolata]